MNTSQFPAQIGNCKCSLLHLSTSL
jgi:hypothetical protein